ncbi:MAG: Sec-independent protein translocase subunit TatA/TatB [Thermoleophilaceae bacterium]|jgi:sec-independent protein translocase protein TatA
MSSIAVVGGIGPLEIGIVLLIVLIIFGPKRIPELGRSLGSGMRGFKESVTGKDKGDDEPERLEQPNTVEASASEDQRDGDPAAAGRAGTAGDTRS